MISPDQQAQATPTALFNFGATLFPTLAAPTSLSTIPVVPTATPNPTATFTPLPTSTPPPATPTSFTSATIVELNKAAEYVEIQNTGNGPLNLTGWKLVSERGNQSCALSGTLQPDETLRVWSRKGASGLSCDFSFNIWNDDQLDPAVLLDPQGHEISRYP